VTLFRSHGAGAMGGAHAFRCMEKEKKNIEEYITYYGGKNLYA
jgi:hypothetical protein